MALKVSPVHAAQVGGIETAAHRGISCHYGHESLACPVDGNLRGSMRHTERTSDLAWSCVRVCNHPQDGRIARGQLLQALIDEPSEQVNICRQCLGDVEHVDVLPMSEGRALPLISSQTVNGDEARNRCKPRPELRRLIETIEVAEGASERLLYHIISVVLAVAIAPSNTRSDSSIPRIQLPERFGLAASCSNDEYGRLIDNWRRVGRGTRVTPVVDHGEFSIRSPLVRIEECELA